MAKKIKQFRYYDSQNTQNSPAVNYQQYVSGSVFAKTLPITQLGIQSLPGTKFYLNNSVDPIIIGSTGIYELDLTGETEISALSFNTLSMQAIEENPNAYLIVDIIYDDGRGNV